LGAIDWCHLVEEVWFEATRTATEAAVRRITRERERRPRSGADRAVVGEGVSEMALGGLGR
jgi:hypothetical protein